jgi:nitroreductase
MEKNNFYQILKSRYSVRRYQNTPIPAESLDRILETGREAASAANRQPWYFIVCSGDDKARLNKVFYRDGFRYAPVVIAAVANMKEAWRRKSDEMNFAYVDVSIAVTEMILAATAEGLGTCWIAAFDYEEAKKILEVPDDMDIVTLFTIGYPHPEDKQPVRVRKSAKEVIFDGRFGNHRE